MLGWYRAQVKEQGLFEATGLLWRVAWSRTTASLINKILPHNVLCPCCGWRAWKFNDYFEVGYKIPNSFCPQCESHERHRELYLWLTNEYRLAEKRGIALIFAPEKSLSALWDHAPYLKICKADIVTARNVDVLLDLQQLAIASDSIDLIWCHHVLEHIENDRAAIAETYRALRPTSGQLVVSVPMSPGTSTNEYGFPNSKESGHWRMYGDDFLDRLAESGFLVQPVDYHLSAAESVLYGIRPGRFYVCKKPAQSHTRPT